MVAEHHDQRLVGGVIEVGGAAGFGQPHGDPVGLEDGDYVQGLPAGEGPIECTHIFYDEDPGTSSFAAKWARRLPQCSRFVVMTLVLAGVCVDASSAVAQQEVSLVGNLLAPERGVVEQV
jgi:hypothetical protein